VNEYRARRDEFCAKIGALLDEYADVASPVGAMEAADDDVDPLDRAEAAERPCHVEGWVIAIEHARDDNTSSWTQRIAPAFLSSAHVVGILYSATDV
jgi:hypothetical protein